MIRDLNRQRAARQPRATVKGYNGIQRELLRLLRQAEDRLNDKRVHLPVVLFASQTRSGKCGITFETVCGRLQAKSLLREYLALGPELKQIRMTFLWQRKEILSIIRTAERGLVQKLKAKRR